MGLSAQAQQTKPTPPPKLPVITAVTQAGIGYVNQWETANGISAQLGRWDTPYPYGDDGDEIPGLEPEGSSQILIDVDVNDGGKAYFELGINTYDAAEFDWMNVTVNTPDGTVNVVSRLGRPGNSYGVFWKSSPTSYQIDLTRWKNKHVQFVFSVEQDGWGDQTQGLLNDFRISGCAVAALNPLTDPVAWDFESHNGNIVDTEHLVPSLQAAIGCVTAAVQEAGGAPSLTSGYRPPDYQSHLREVYVKWKILKKDKSPECATLKAMVGGEFNMHGLGASSVRPAGPSGFHSRGLAFDMNWLGTNRSPNLGKTTIDALAAECQLRRPLSGDPVHFEPNGSRN
jgi:hypothetical protein